MIEALNFPNANLKLTRSKGVVHVWCIIRKKKLVCTPEEWVRQHVIHYLIDFKSVPVGLIASEYSLEYNGMIKRADVVVFNTDRKPVLLIECKAPSVPISEKTLFQIAQYNFKLNVDLLVLTNGLHHFSCRINRDTNEMHFSDDFR